MQSVSPTYRSGAGGLAWYCSCPEELMPDDAHGIRWCRGVEEKHAWKRTPEGGWILVGRTTYDRETKLWGAPVAVEVGA